jgi:hypothetical protein
MDEPLVRLTTTYQTSIEPQCVIRTHKKDGSESEEIPEFDFESLDAEKCVFLRSVHFFKAPTVLMAVFTITLSVMVSR